MTQNAGAVRSETLKVPGASLHYETRGRGPLLIMIPGGPTDAGIFARLAEALADRYTAVAYDPRGNSRSTFDGAPVEQDMDVHADDAAALIGHLGAGAPVFVLGNSGGAQIGLNLAARHPGRVHTLVAHEPPCMAFLDDGGAALKENVAICETFEREGVAPAMARFMKMAGFDGSPVRKEPPSAALQATFARMGGNMTYFLRHGVKPISAFVPDVAALRAGPVRVIVGIGEESVAKGQLPARTATALAARLGTKPVMFAGDHNGFGEHASAFAETLHRTLS